LTATFAVNFLTLAEGSFTCGYVATKNKNKNSFIGFFLFFEKEDKEGK
jgi:hypothetical protein